LEARVDMLENRVTTLEGEVRELRAQLLAMQGKYVVQPGDTLAKIALTHEIAIDRLMYLNPGLDGRHLRWTPKTGQGGWLKLKPSQSHVEETSFA